MKLSNQYIKSIKSEDSAVFDSRSHELLVKAGFIDQVASGIYTLLPPGLKVLTRIEQIVREEMDALGALETLMPNLHPKTLWDQTRRWDKVDVLFKLKSAHDREYGLGPTHEEVVTPLAKKYIQSYKDLPLALYQISTKFRDEARPKSGIMRGREFRMKDMYSFHSSRDDLRSFYEKVTTAYMNAFARMGFDNVRITEASGGDFTEKYSHEFNVITPAGEVDLVYCTGCSFSQNEEVVKGDITVCPKCGGELARNKAIEIGNIFDLEYKFSESFDLKYVDEEGKKHLVFMGCYGIGTSRLIGAIVETHNDEHGIMWPESVSPFHVHLSCFSEEKKPFADLIYRSLQAEHIDTVYDDRIDVSPGQKLAIADLIGAPVRLIVSDKAKDNVEMKLRDSDKKRLFSAAEIIQHLKDYFIK